MAKERLKFIDIARAFAIIFIAFGHTIVYSEHCKIIYKILYSFHVVLFFILSGYTFKIKEEERFSTFLKNKFFRIMIPYFFWAIVFIVPYLILGQNTGNIIGTASSFNWITQVKNVFYGNGNDFALKQNSSLWFLPALFSMEIVYYFIIKYEEKNKLKDAIFIVAELLLSYITYWFFKMYLPWGLNTVIELGVFFDIGYLYRKNNIISEKNKLFNIKSMIIVFSIGVLAGYLNTRNVSAIDYKYGILTLAMISGICLSTTVIYIAYKVKENRILEYIGRNTMGILVFHKIIILIFQTKMGVISSMLRNSNVIIELIISSIIVILSIFFSIIITEIIRKTFPCLIGEQRKMTRKR